MKNHNRYFWRCVCDCGNEVVREGKTLKDKNSFSRCESCCKEENAKFFRDHNPRASHRLTKTRQYKIYHKIKERCYNPNSISFPLYGGQGVKVCKEWLESFESFYKWSIENGYDDSLSIDRINSDGDYEPSNCRWVDKYVQANNKRNNIVFTHNGETHSLPDWARLLGLPTTTLTSRYRKGKTIEQILDPIKHGEGSKKVKKIS